MQKYRLHDLQLVDRTRKHNIGFCANTCTFVNTVIINAVLNVNEVSAYQKKIKNLILVREDRKEKKRRKIMRILFKN